MELQDILNLKLFSREKLKSILEWIDDERLILITGSRQVGKTCILYLLIKEIYQKAEKNVFYFDLEDFEILKTLNSGVSDFIQLLKAKGADPGKRQFVFIDEIQYLDNPSNFLKLIADHHKNIKLIASGSSTLDIKRKFKDSLAGRKIVFEIDTLRFSEYLLFRNNPELLSILKQFKLRDLLDGKNFKFHQILEIHKKGLQREFENYITYGGYPAVIKEENVSKKTDLIYEIYTSYVRKDINQLFSIENVSGFNDLVKMLALQIGSLVNDQRLTTDLKTTHLTLTRYIFVLQNTFIVKLISPFFKNRRREIVKMPKVYFYDTGLRNAVIKTFTDSESRPDTGFIVENYLFGMLNSILKSNEDLKFWRTKNGVEVDFVIETNQLLPIESKYQIMKSPQIPSGLASFVDKYSPPKALVITKEYFQAFKKDKTTFYFLPAWLLG